MSKFDIYAAAGRDVGFDDSHCNQIQGFISRSDNPVARLHGGGPRAIPGTIYQCLDRRDTVSNHALNGDEFEDDIVAERSQIIVSHDSTDIDEACGEFDFDRIGVVHRN